MASDTSQKTWELNVYELNRQPHTVITDDTEIAVSPKSLHNELMCPICLDILKSTMTTKECLHRFCQDCIITALRAGNKECPTCRKKLISKRSLRPDPNFDALISKIYPNREEYDTLHEKVLEKLNKKHLSAKQEQKTQKEKRNKRGLNANNSHNDEDNMPRSSAAIEVATPKQESSSSTRKRTISENDSDLESRTSTERSQLVQQDQDYDEVEVILKPNLKETQHTSQRYLKTTTNATISHLSKYLHTRLCIETNKIETLQNGQQNHTSSNSSVSGLDFSIQILTNGQYQTLNGGQTLEQTCERYWKFNKPLELYYSSKQTQI